MCHEPRWHKRLCWGFDGCHSKYLSKHMEPKNRALLVLEVGSSIKFHPSLDTELRECPPSMSLKRTLTEDLILLNTYDSIGLWNTFREMSLFSYPSNRCGDLSRDLVKSCLTCFCYHHDHTLPSTPQHQDPPPLLSHDQPFSLLPSVWKLRFQIHAP